MAQTNLPEPMFGRKVYHIEEHPEGFGAQVTAIVKLAILAAPWIGIQSIWQAEFSVTTPFLESLGLSPYWSSQVWMSGPIMGFIVAPIVGSLSDATTSRLGRRRPWMLGGIVFLGIVSVLLAGAKDMLGEDNALPLAFPLFMIMDGAINVIQTPTRAFLADLAPAKQQLPGQLLAAMFQGFGAMVGYGISLSLYNSEEKDIFWLFIVVFFVNLGIFSIVSLIVTEQPIAKPEEPVSLCTPVFHVFYDIIGMDKRLLKVGMVNAFSWIGLFSYWPVASTWMGKVVFEGCPDIKAEGCDANGTARFSEGQSAYNEMGIYNSLLQVLLSFVLTFTFYYGYIKRVRFIYAAGLFCGAAICFLGKFGPETVGMGKAIAVLLAVPVSVITSYPFAIVGRYNVEKDGGQDTGTQFGILNLFIVVPQLATTFIVSAMRSSIGDDEGLEWVLFFSSINFAIAGVLALFIEEPGRDDDTAEVEPTDLAAKMDI